MSQGWIGMVPPMTTKRMTTALLLALGLLAAGCGGGGDGKDDDVASVSGDEGEESAQADEEDGEAELIDWAECMRDQGIDIPDPTRDADGNLVLDGPGIHIGPGEVGISSESGEDGEEEEPAVGPEEMGAAMEECGEPPALGGQDMSEEDRAKMEENALEFAECMRSEGIEDFPDPDFSGEGPGGAAEHRVDGGPEDRPEGGPGEAPQERVVLGPFGEIDLNDPEISAAFEACRDVIGVPEAAEGGPGSLGGPAGGGSSAT
jgi:hypothetical protein